MNEAEIKSALGYCGLFATRETVNEARPADHTIYVKVEGGVVQSIAVRGFGENPCFDVVVHDLDSIEAGDEEPQIIKDNGGELPDDFLFIW